MLLVKYLVRASFIPELVLYDRKLQEDIEKGLIEQLCQNKRLITNNHFSLLNTPAVLPHMRQPAVRHAKLLWRDLMP
jgi:hypothetical protein